MSEEIDALPPLHELQQFETRTIARSQIKNAPYNPRKIAQANRVKLEQLLTEFGLVETLVWNSRTGNLVGGHQRLAILDLLSESGENYSLTVAVVDLDEVREKALNASLNAKSAQGEYDSEKLKSLLAEIEGQISIDLSALMSNEKELRKIARSHAEAQYPITAKLNERYDYVLIFCDNETDFAFLQTLCGVHAERSYKKTGIGLGRAIPFKRFVQSIRENHHSLDVQRGVNDDAPASA